MTCPYIVTSDEGTSYCRLAEEAIKRKDLEIAELQAKLDKRLWVFKDNETIALDECENCGQALQPTETRHDR